MAMAMALIALARDAALLPSDWVTSTRKTTRAGIARELDTDRRYRSLTTRLMGRAAKRSRAADVRGVQRLLTQVRDGDRELGEKRPEAVTALVASIEVHLQAAQQLRLARDRWELRRPDFRRYDAAVSKSFNRFSRLKSPLEDIKALAGSSPRTLMSIERAAAQVMEAFSVIMPPEELRAAHALVLGAVRLADRAARIRREAMLSGDLARAWDASSAAAGALMLEARARTEIQAVTSVPQLSR